MSTVPPDLALGAFSDSAPWIVDPAELSWDGGIDQIRKRAQRDVPRLLRSRRIPPGMRVLKVGRILGKAVASWYLIDSRKSKMLSRSALSRRLRIAFERLGPTYIKLGQIISSGEGIFPPELVQEFRKLRDKVPAEDFATTRRTVETDLGQPLEEIFSHFEQEPIAAASIAQVHLARLQSGEEVVVKVQRPSVSTLVRQDLAAMSWIAPALVGRIPVAALANPPALVELFAETIVEELDFRLEAQNMLDVARVLVQTGSRSLVVPRPHSHLVTKRVLVMQRLEGFTWDDVAGMRAAGIDTSQVVRAGMVGFLEGAMLHGVFHGDLHGGNLLVRPDGTVALLDHGITGRLNDFKRLAFLRLLVGGTMGDPRFQVAALRDLGALPQDTDIEGVVRDLALDGPGIDPTKLTPNELTSEIRNLTKALLSYGARMPKELMLFVKNLLFLNGAMATLAPDVDLLAEIALLANHFSTRFGEQIAREVGVPVNHIDYDVNSVRATLGLGSDVESITYKELQERRELIRSRMELRRSRGRRKQHLKRHGTHS